MRRWKCEKS